MHQTCPLVRPDAPTVVLASGSPTRAALLRAAGLPFTVVRPIVDEESLRDSLAAAGVGTRDAAVALAELKARRVGAGLEGEDVIVLGADQLLELEGRWLAKPADRTAAREQLLRLRGRVHHLVTAAVAFRGSTRIWHVVDGATLHVRPFQPEFLDAYLDAAGETVLASVGGYQLEGLGAHLMSRVQGDHFTILGLPLLQVLEFLREQGVVAR